MGVKEFVIGSTKTQKEFNREFSTFLLTLPIPMNYIVWKGLHKIKGDWIE